jgi:hypothetical protein
VPRVCAFPHEALNTLFPGGIAARALLVALGMSHSTISRRCRPGGPWRRLIPGVVMLNNGNPTRQHLSWAALTHAGPKAMVTGLAAARLHGLKHIPDERRVHVLIPHESRVATWGFATIERTIHLPEKPVEINGVPVAPLARALIDAARRMDRLEDVRAMIAEAVQRGLCDPADLQHELNLGTTIGSALPQRVVHEMNEAVRSATEEWARRVIRRGALPEPEWNVEVRDASGAVLGFCDAWWPDVGLAWEIDSLEYRLGPADDEQATEKSPTMNAAGILVVHTFPSQLRDNPLAVIKELRAAYQQAAGLPPPELSARPAC